MQIREEEKQTSIITLASCLGVDVNNVPELINNSMLPKSIQNNRYFSSELVAFLLKWPSLPAFEVGDEGNEYLNDLLESFLLEEQGGIFVLPQHDYQPQHHSMSELIAKCGLWNAQGINNHIHLSEITENIVHQALLAQTIIDKWIVKINSLQLSNDCVVYWNGPVDSTLCIYLTAGNDLNFLKEYDDYLGIKSILVREIECTEIVFT